eukprot:744304-Heterocapsa_arctica.AAC.1
MHAPLCTDLHAPFTFCCCLVIRCTFLAQNAVAHPMETARARPDSPVTPNILLLHVLRDPSDGSFSKCRCESDGASR